jgi:hypothetical protein
MEGKLLPIKAFSLDVYMGKEVKNECTKYLVFKIYAKFA